MGDHQSSWRLDLDGVLNRYPVTGPRPDDSSGSISAETLASVEAQVRAIVSAPRMYDEPDHGIRLALPVSEDEDRITSGAPVPADGLDASEHPHPSLMAAFENQQTTFVVDAEKSDDNGPTQLTGYPVDAWRYTPTALAVRVSFKPPTRVYTYEQGIAGTDYIVLPDNREWTATSADGTTLSHVVHDHWL